MFDPLVFFKIISIFILLGMSAFFSGSEAALFSLPHEKRKKLGENGTKTGKILADFWKQPSQLLSSILVANEITNITTTSLITSTIISLTGENKEELTIFIIGIMLLVFGEIPPKTIAVYSAEKWATFCAYPLYFISKITFPIFYSLQWTANAILSLVKVPERQEAETYTEEEFKTLLNMVSTEGILESDEQEMIENILDFSTTKVREIMTPRTDIFAFKIDDPISTIVTQIKKTPHSRIPIYNKTLDNIEGILYTKDLLLNIALEESKTLDQLIHPVFFVPLTQKVDDLLKAFKKKKVHMAVVVDEYGGTAGLITLEDILEEIFGEITDEYDTETKEIVKLHNNIYAVSAQMSLDEFNKQLNIVPPLSGADSVGGFLLSAFGRIPVRGEKLRYNNIDFIIRRSKATRITHILVKISPKSTEKENLESDG